MSEMPRGGVGGTWRVPGEILGVGGRTVFVFEKKILKRTSRFAPERAGFARVAPVERFETNTPPCPPKCGGGVFKIGGQVVKVQACMIIDQMFYFVKGGKANKKDEGPGGRGWGD